MTKPESRIKAERMQQLWAIEELEQRRVAHIEWDMEHYNESPYDSPIDPSTVTVDFVNEDGFYYSEYTYEPGTHEIQIFGRLENGQPLYVSIDPDEFNFLAILQRMIELSEENK